MNPFNTSSRVRTNSTVPIASDCKSMTQNPLTRKVHQFFFPGSILGTWELSTVTFKAVTLDSPFDKTDKELSCQSIQVTFGKDRSFVFEDLSSRCSNTSADLPSISAWQLNDDRSELRLILDNGDEIPFGIEFLTADTIELQLMVYDTLGSEYNEGDLLLLAKFCRLKPY